MGDSAVATAPGVYGFPAVLTSFIGRGGPLREVAVLLEQHRPLGEPDREAGLKTLAQWAARHGQDFVAKA